jgi:hypothetical protein
MESNVKFISYDGDYPCLCYGTLVIEVKGKVYELKNVLVSGGSVWFDPEECSFDVVQGEWEISDIFLPDELKPYIDEITEVVNCEVPYGCCGGCI